MQTYTIHCICLPFLLLIIFLLLPFSTIQVRKTSRPNQHSVKTISQQIHSQRQIGRAKRYSLLTFLSSSSSFKRCSSNLIRSASSLARCSASCACFFAASSCN